MTTTTKRRRASKSVEAYSALRAEIISGELRPGDPLAEEAIAEWLGTSRTPVREALKALRSEGWVEASESGRVTVAGVSLADLRELYQMRNALETAAARLAAESPRRLELTPYLEELDNAREPVAGGQHDSYHGLMARIDRAVVDVTGNSRLAASLDDVWSHLSRIRSVVCTDPPELLESIRRRHGILEAIVSGDAALAGRLAGEHVDAGFHMTTTSIASGLVSDPMLVFRG